MSEIHNTQTSRRHFLKLAAGTVMAVAVGNVLVRPARAADDLPHLAEDDAMAKALKYTHDHTTAANDAKYKEGDDCSNCQFYHGADGDEWGPCDLFPGKAVNAKGWCVSHSPKQA